MTELLVVIAVLTTLLGLLFPLVAGVRKSGQLTKSMSHMRQIAGWMTLYASDNRDFVLPSQFDYSANRYKGHVRSVGPAAPPLPGDIPPTTVGGPSTGSWADIIWTEFQLGPIPGAAANGTDPGYDNDSPDAAFYREVVDRIGGFENPLRSAVANSSNSDAFRHSGASDMVGAAANMYLATPFGAGAAETGQPGYFAANNFFNAAIGAEDARTRRVIPAGWYTNAQIREPGRSMYLIDSFAGEVIQPWPERFKLPIVTADSDPDPTPSILQDNQVDFRYSDLCLMLFLDGHSETHTKWAGIEDLEGFAKTDDQGNVVGAYRSDHRQIRIRNLDRRISSFTP
jgi:type II secretory pathway pseudopilin PulG